MIRLVNAYSYKDEVRELFSEYTAMLIEGDPQFKEYLSIQNFDRELEDLEYKYGLPYGRLYLVYCGESLAGCIGLRKISNDICEMKRLYVRPLFRKNGIGDFLVKRTIADAKEIGYKKMRLDTLPFLTSAEKLYRKNGFYDIPCYNNSPMHSSIYMQLDL